MSSSEDMPRADLTDEKLKTQRAYAKYLEAKNFARAVRAKKILQRKRLIFGVCWGLVLGIYGMTIAGIKQETFLDDFEEPPRQIKDK